MNTFDDLKHTIPDSPWDVTWKGEGFKSALDKMSTTEMLHSFKESIIESINRSHRKSNVHQLTLIYKIMKLFESYMRDANFTLYERDRAYISGRQLNINLDTLDLRKVLKTEKIMLNIINRIIDENSTLKQYEADFLNKLSKDLKLNETNK